MNVPSPPSLELLRQIVVDASRALDLEEQVDCIVRLLWILSSNSYGSFLPSVLTPRSRVDCNYRSTRDWSVPSHQASCPRTTDPSRRICRPQSALPALSHPPSFELKLG